MSGWCSYERTWFNENGEVSGKCRWSAPPPIEGEGFENMQIMVWDDKKKAMVPIPDGFTCPFLPSDDPEW